MFEVTINSNDANVLGRIQGTGASAYIVGTVIRAVARDSQQLLAIVSICAELRVAILSITPIGQPT
jgi:hypothetical protein